MTRFLALHVLAVVWACSTLGYAQTVIDVGTWELLPNQAEQQIELIATPGDNVDLVSGFNLRAVIGDGTGPAAEPIFGVTDFLSGTIWDTNDAVTIQPDPVGAAKQASQAFVVFSQTDVSVPADGRIAMLSIDTTGFASGTFPLKLTATEIGAPSVFVATGADEIIPSILNGSIVIGGSVTCGDFDQDGDVDSADRTRITQNWTGALAAGVGNSTFEQGDCDGDGDVDSADLTGIVQNWTGAQAGNLSDRDDHADLVYDPTSGNVTIDASETGSGQIISFVVGTEQNNLREENTQFPFLDVGTNTDNTSFQIGQTDPLNQGAGSLVDLGNIFPVGMTADSLSEYLSLAEYASELGAGGELDLVVVPEPSAWLLAGLAGVLLIARRRKK